MCNKRWSGFIWWLPKKCTSLIMNKYIKGDVNLSMLYLKEIPEILNEALKLFQLAV